MIGIRNDHVVTAGVVDEIERHGIDRASWRKRKIRRFDR
jgi:hypothetical protein